MSSPHSVLEVARDYCALDPNPVTRKTLQDAISRKDTNKLSEWFNVERIEFGTAGLRAAFGIGPALMNDLVVLQTAQGLCDALEISFGVEKVKRFGICVGFDHRESKEFNLSSKKFAYMTAAVFLRKGYRVVLFKNLVATPLVPFCIGKMRCVAGVMVTASHNPKQDDGYKLYWENGCQIISPIDSLIASCILKNLTPWTDDYDYENVAKINQLCDNVPDEEIISSYFTTATQRLHRYDVSSSPAHASLSFAYTPMHGVGLSFAKRMFQSFALPPCVVVQEQAEPDPDFPTVKFPNPEEKGALRIACNAAEVKHCSLVIANDPDADRFAAAEWSGVEWKVFTGDELAILFAWWELHNFRKNKSNQARPALVVSAVSSGFLKEMGKKEDFLVEEALTGFKWIGNKVLELRSKGVDVLFSYEEAIGFCVGDVVCDKDGITAAAVFMELCNYLRNERKSTCSQHLLGLYEQYGHFVTRNGYVKTNNAKQIFKRLRQDKVEYLMNKQYKVMHVRDLDKTVYFDSREADGKPKLPPTSLMITYFIEPLSIRLTLRASGTEPKLKYYLEANNSRDKSISPAILAERLEAFEKQAILHELLSNNNNKL